jgi:GT2 family glycosyltransferase
VRIIQDNGAFNFSRICNNGVRFVEGEFVCLLNNDIEVISPDWLGEMVSLAVQPEIGAVGAKLIYPDGTIQHAGVIMGLGGVAGHVLSGQDRKTFGYFGRGKLVQELSAVTAACLVVSKSKYTEISGFNESDLAVAFNDVDFCLRLKQVGYRNLWTPYAELYHHESASRGRENTKAKQARFNKEVEYMNKNWAEIIQNDPAYNPNLSLIHGDFSLAWPPREVD